MTGVGRSPAPHRVVSAELRAQIVQAEFGRRYPPGSWLPYIHEEIETLPWRVTALIKADRPVEAEFWLLQAEKFAGCIDHDTFQKRVKALDLAGESKRVDIELGVMMTDSRAYLSKAADALASTMTGKRDWPVDLDDSAPHWAELLTRLGELKYWVRKGAVMVRDDAENLPRSQRQPLVAKAAGVVSTLNQAGASRPEVDHTWRMVAASFARAQESMSTSSRGRQSVREVRVAGAVYEAARAVRNAARQRLAAGDVVAVLQAVSVLYEAMCGLVARIAVAVERRDKECPELAGVSRSLQRGIHNPYRDAGEYFAAAAEICREIMTRWPGRWPNSA